MWGLSRGWVLFALFALVNSPVTALESLVDERPNILLLVAEDMSSRVGAFGDETAVTPNIDRLAAEGVRFTNVFTTAGVCAPSRAALITGMHQVSIGAQHMRTTTYGPSVYLAIPPPQVKAFPELLRREGYYTFTDTKLDYQFSGIRSGSGPFTIWDQEGRGSSWKQRKPGQPFFGMINFMHTHESGLFSRTTPARNEMHLVMSKMQSQLHAGSKAVVGAESVKVPPYYSDTEIVRKDIARQYNNIYTMDQKVGEILAELEQDGLADNTIVIWTTDHGDGFPRAKRELYDSGLKVPMVIRWPAAYRPVEFAQGSIDRRLISFVDMAPTLLKMAGAEQPTYVHGASFYEPENYEAEEEAKRKYIYASRDRMDAFHDRQRAVRDKRFKYIRNYYPEKTGYQKLSFRENVDMMRELGDLFAQGALNDIQQRWFLPRGSRRVVRHPKRSGRN